MTRRAALLEALSANPWDAFPGAKAIRALAPDPSPEALHAALSLLWENINEEDQRLGQEGRDSHVFEFYDTGIAKIWEDVREALSGI